MTIIVALALFALSASAQAKKDTARSKQPPQVEFSPAEVVSLYNNCNLLKSQIHALHMDALFRDRLDTLIDKNKIIIERRLIEFNQKTKPNPNLK